MMWLLLVAVGLLAYLYGIFITRRQLGLELTRRLEVEYETGVADGLLQAQVLPAGSTVSKV